MLRPDTPFPGKKKLPPLENKFNGSDLNLNQYVVLKETHCYNGKKLGFTFDKKENYTFKEVLELLERYDKYNNVPSYYS